MGHHAYIYEGAQALLIELAQDARVHFGFHKDHDPDVHVEGWEKFGINDAQKLKEEAGLRSTSGRTLFVLGMASLTSEAQQALLKLLEEPQAGSVFVLLLPHGTLLPTLRSRMLAYPGKIAHGGKTHSSRFLSASSKDRSAYITLLLKDEENQKERVRDFLHELEAQLYKKINNKEARAGLSDIAKVRSYVADRSPSLKMLLEHLATTLPVI